MLYGVTVRQTCPLGQSAFAPWQRQRPVTPVGCCEHIVVADTDSQALPLRHALPQPPQCDVFDAMLTQPPPQQRFAELAPHWIPSPRYGCVQVPVALQTSFVHALPSSAQAAPLWRVWAQAAVPLHVRVVHGSLAQVRAVPLHEPAIHRSVCVQGSPSSQGAMLGSFTQVPLAQRSSVQTF